jgi:H/ACA ribonucleoprotein complex subunit 3
MISILRCSKCLKYTLKEDCSCGGKALTPKPAKFSIEDKYGSYRRKAKYEHFKNEGLI